MQTYMMADAHREAMPKLVEWSDEASFVNLFSVRMYIQGEFGEFLEDIAPILTQYLGESRPALTGIGVASLTSPETLVEVEATAALK